MSVSLETKSCSVKRVIPAKPTTVSVNGIVLSRAAIAREMQHHPAAKPIDAWFAAARALVIRELLLQEARRLQLTSAPLADADGRRETDEEALIRMVLDQEVVTPQADTAACRRYYDQNQKRFVTPDLFYVSHILIPIEDKDGGANAAKAQADALLSRLREHPDAFGHFAKEYSACPSREVDGSLGQIGPGQTVAEFENALEHLPVGEVASEPVRTRYGFHIVRVDRRISGQKIPFDMVSEKIADFLNDRVRHVAERQYIGVLAGQAKIEGIDLDAIATPLVQ